MIATKSSSNPWCWLQGLLLAACVSLSAATAREPLPGQTEYAERAARMLVAATEAGDELATAQAQTALAEHMLILSLWPQAVIHADLARDAAAKSGDPRARLAADIVYGRLLSNIERIAEATEVLLQAIEQARALDDGEQEAWALLGLSNSYLHARMLDAAEEAARDGLTLAERNGDTLLQVRFLNNLGLIAWTGGDVDTAREYVRRAGLIDADLPSDVHKVLVMASITLAGAQDQADIERARELVEQSTRDGSVYMTAFAKEQLARILCSNGSDVEALTQFAEAEAGFKASDAPADLRRLHEHWGECLALLGQHELALHHQREAIRLFEEVQNLRQTATLQALDAAFRTEQRLTELAQMASEEQRLQARLAAQRARMAALIAGILILLAIAYALAMRNRVLRQREQAAEALVQARVDLLARTSHEIRNPAQALIGLLEADSVRSGSDSNTAHLAAARMIGRLANDCLDLALLEQGRLHLQSNRVFELRAFVDQVMTLARAQRGCDDIKLVARIDATVPDRVRIDGERLAQVLMNLLGNAMHYAGNGSIPLDVHISEDGRDLVFAVSDHGPGLGANPSELFDPYRRAGATGQHQRGAGLGLAISARIVRAMGGEIEAGNRDPVGACFKVRVPLQPDTDVEQPRTMLRGSSRLGPDLAELPSCRVALIDDDPLVRLGLRALLESLGQQVQDRASGKGLEQLLDQFDPDLVLIDQHLDDGSGCDLAARIRAHDRTHARDRLLVIVSGSGDPKDADLGDIDDWLIKPVGREDLLPLLLHCRRDEASED